MWPCRIKFPLRDPPAFVVEARSRSFTTMSYITAFNGCITAFNGIGRAPTTPWKLTQTTLGKLTFDMLYGGPLAQV